jgi:hypothetical protein
MSDFERFGLICEEWLDAAKEDTSEEEDKGWGVVSHLRPVMLKRPRFNRGSPPKARQLLLARS